MKSIVNTKQMLARLAVVILITLCATLPSCDKGDDPKPTPIPPVVPTVSVIALATPTAVAYGGKSKIVVEAQNASTITISLNGVEVKSVSATATEFETPDLLVTTTYQVVAKSGTQTKVTDVTVTVSPIDPKLKLLLDGKWQLVKSEVKRPGETLYSDSPNNSCRLDDTFIFYLNNTCITTWGPTTCFPDEFKLGTSIYYGGFDTAKMILLWQQNDPWDVLEITDKKLRIHTMTAQWGDFTILSDYIQEYKNVK